MGLYFIRINHQNRCIRVMAVYAAVSSNVAFAHFLTLVLRFVCNTGELKEIPLNESRFIFLANVPQC